MSEVVFGSHLDLDSNEIRNARLLNLTSGTAPGTPADGDVWTTTSGIYARINGATVGPLLGSTVWGTVTGTLSDQTDLQSALDLKAPLASPTFTGTVSLSTLTADTINGRDPDDLVLGPASATDNALVRFDGTGGKTVQDTPGLTVNDSGFITSDLVVSKASPNLYSLASSGNSTFYLASVAGATCQFVLRTGSFSNRWIFGKEGTAESGSNAGSNFTLMSYDDAGVLLRTDLTITRSTGAVTLAGTLAVTDTTDATSHITGSVKLSGGMGIAKKLYVGTDLNVAGIPTFTGTNVYHSVTGSATDFITGTQYGTLKITSGVGYTSSVVFNAGTTAGSGQRWLIFKDESTESGSNVGSDLMIRNYSDAGAYISTPLTITRSTGAVTLTGTLNGKIVNDLVTGPASATDNALVRFDNTTGKVVQNSGITVNDSGYITSDVTMSKASPILSVSASTTTTASIYFDNAAAGSYGRFLFRVNGSKRWECGRDGTAEAGANAGSDFYISNYSDASAAIGIPFKIARSTGKTTLGYVGATAGLELGTSGPRVMSGTGSPEGVVTAPVGSRWIRTDGDALGDFEYQKRSGTGNTGWVVADGDTGWRNITSLATANAGQTLADFMVRRIGGVVYLQAQFAQSTTNTVFELFANGTWPSGFNIPTQTDETVISGGRGSGSGYTASSLGLNTNAASVADVKYRVDNASYMYFHGSWPTSDAWPSSLPGSAA